MVTRRHLLGAGSAAVAASLSGCLAPPSPDFCDDEAPPPAGLRVENRADTAHVVEIEVVRDLLLHVETVFEERFEVAAGDRVEVPDVAETVGRHILTARLAEGATARLYWTVTPGACNPAVVAVTADGLELSQPDGVDRGPPAAPGGNGGGGSG